MDNRQLKDFLNSLTEEQLDQEVMFQDESKCFILMGTDILKEDHINPSGEGAEPISMYLPGGAGYDEDYTFEDYSDEPIVLSKGQVIYFID